MAITLSFRAGISDLAHIFLWNWTIVWQRVMNVAIASLPIVAHRFWRHHRRKNHNQKTRHYKTLYAEARHFCWLDFQQIRITVPTTCCGSCNHLQTFAYTYISSRCCFSRTLASRALRCTRKRGISFRRICARLSVWNLYDSHNNRLIEKFTCMRFAAPE